MSEERLEPVGEPVGPSDKKGKKPAKEKKRRRNRVAKWFREMKSELKKVIWPTPKQMLNNSVIVLVIMVISAIVIWAVDQAGSYIVNALLLLKG
jgi:preprotein translocase subunit SecE